MFTTQHAIGLLAAVLVAVGTHAQQGPEDDSAYMKREHSLVKPYHGEYSEPTRRNVAF